MQGETALNTCMCTPCNIKSSLQIADFGMSRDLEDDNYYTSSGGLIPIKWTAIEVRCAMQGIVLL